jgi:hypothetical protein
MESGSFILACHHGVEASHRGVVMACWRDAASTTIHTVRQSAGRMPPAQLNTSRAIAASWQPLLSDNVGHPQKPVGNSHCGLKDTVKVGGSYCDNRTQVGHKSAAVLLLS